jgi:hypothetical protein
VPDELVDTAFSSSACDQFVLRAADGLHLASPRSRVYFHTYTSHVQLVRSLCVSRRRWSKSRFRVWICYGDDGKPFPYRSWVGRTIHKVRVAVHTP